MGAVGGERPSRNCRRDRPHDLHPSDLRTTTSKGGWPSRKMLCDSHISSQSGSPTMAIYRDFEWASATGLSACWVLQKGNTCGVAWQFRRTPRLLYVGAGANVQHFADNMVEDLFDDGAEELVAGDRLTSGRSQEPGVELNVCLSAPSSWALSYSNFSKRCTQCTNHCHCTWLGADGPAGAELGLQQTEYPVIARAVRAALLAQLSQEFGDGSLQVARSAAFLQDSDSLGW